MRVCGSGRGGVFITGCFHGEMKESSEDICGNGSVIRVLLIADDPGDVRGCAAMLEAATDTAFIVSYSDRIKRGANPANDTADVVIVAASALQGKPHEAVTGFRTGKHRIPVILLTGENESKPQDMVRRYAAQDYLIKEELTATLLSRTLRYAVQFERMRQSLDELEDMKNGFTSGISHELRIPLHSIQGFTQLLLEGADEDRDTRLEFLNIINQQSERLSNTIDILLDASVVAPGQFDIETAPTLFQDIVRGAIEYVTPNAAEKSVTIVADTAAADITLKADNSRLKQVISQLLHNAVKFSDSDSVINLRTRIVGDEIELTVEDYGIGIPEECLPYIFDRFYQVKNRYHVEGMGVGLYFARQLILAHGGRLQVKSTSGKGSLFTLTLPIFKGGGELTS
jgi:signal transduction histidine kinase